jgi:hypothetical protein
VVQARIWRNFELIFVLISSIVGKIVICVKTEKKQLKIYTFAFKYIFGSNEDFCVKNF